LSVKEPYVSAKEKGSQREKTMCIYVSAKGPCVSAKEPCLSVKEPCVSAEEKGSQVEETQCRHMHTHCKCIHIVYAYTCYLHTQFNKDMFTSLI